MLRAVTLLLLLCSAAPHAADRVVTTPSGDDIPVSVSGADSDHLLLWLGSEFGGTPRRTALAEAIAATGAQVWSVDLHAAWFLPVGRYSLNDVDPAAIAALIDAAVAHAGHVYLMAEGRVAALALSGVRTWQLAEHAGPGLRGLLTFSPRLYTRTPQGASRRSTWRSPRRATCRSMCCSRRRPQASGASARTCASWRKAVQMFSCTACLTSPTASMPAPSSRPPSRP